MNGQAVYKTSFINKITVVDRDEILLGTLAGSYSISYKGNHYNSQSHVHGK
jgi:hypothetical protein